MCFIVEFRLDPPTIETRRVGFPPHLAQIWRVKSNVKYMHLKNWTSSRQAVLLPCLSCISRRKIHTAHLE